MDKASSRDEELYNLIDKNLQPNLDEDYDFDIDDLDLKGKTPKVDISDNNNSNILNEEKVPILSQTPTDQKEDSKSNNLNIKTVGSNQFDQGNSTHGLNSTK